MKTLHLLVPTLLAGLLMACSGEYDYHGEYQLSDPDGTAVEVLTLEKDSTFWFYGKDAQNPGVPAIWSSAGTWSLRNDTVVLSSYEDENKIPLAEGKEWKTLGYTSEETDYLDYYPLPLSRKYAVNNGFLYSPEKQTTLKKPGAGEG